MNSSKNTIWGGDKFTRVNIPVQVFTLFLDILQRKGGAALVPEFHNSFMFFSFIVSFSWQVCVCSAKGIPWTPFSFFSLLLFVLFLNFPYYWIRLFLKVGERLLLKICVFLPSSTVTQAPLSFMWFNKRPQLPEVEKSMTVSYPSAIFFYSTVTMLI